MMFNLSNNDLMFNLSSNETIHEVSSFQLTLKKVSDILAICILLLIMFTMGADIKFKQIIDHLKLPIGIIIGMICQFIAMPLIGFSLSQALQLKGPSVLGVILISCCPGGALSNIITYLLDGDVSLSVTMTSISTLLALGFMPFNFWLYGHWVDVGNLVIPYTDMIISVAYVSVPAFFGIALKWKLPKIANYVTKIGSILGISMIVLCTTLYNIVFPDMLKNSHWKYCVAVIIMPLAGFSFGFGAAYIFKRNTAVCKTIGVESGIQNVAIAFGILAITSFTFEEQKTVSLFPMLYSITMTSMGVFSGVSYRIYKCINKGHSKKMDALTPLKTEKIEIISIINSNASSTLK